MLALYLMLLATYYAQNYAGIIGWSLVRCHVLLLLPSTMLRHMVTIYRHIVVGTCLLSHGVTFRATIIIVVVFKHALCGSCRQYVMYCCRYLQPCFVWVLSTVCYALLLLSSTMLCVGLVDIIRMSFTVVIM